VDEPATDGRAGRRFWPSPSLRLHATTRRTTGGRRRRRWPLLSFPDDPVADSARRWGGIGLAGSLLVLEPGESWHYAKP